MNFVTSFFVETDGARVNCMQATWDLVTDRYSVRNNLVLQFKRDEIDQSPRLAETLFNRFGRDGELEYSRQVSPRAWGGWGAGDRGGVAGRRVAWSCPRECFSGGCFIPDECFYLLLLSVFSVPCCALAISVETFLCSSLFFPPLPLALPARSCGKYCTSTDVALSLFPGPLFPPIPTNPIQAARHARYPEHAGLERHAASTGLG